MTEFELRYIESRNCPKLSGSSEKPVVLLKERQPRGQRDTNGYDRFVRLIADRQSRSVATNQCLSEECTIEFVRFPHVNENTA